MIHSKPEQRSPKRSEETQITTFVFLHPIWFLLSLMAGKLFSFLDLIIQGDDFQPYIGMTAGCITYLALSTLTITILPEGAEGVASVIWFLSFFILLPLVIVLTFFYLN